MFTPPEQQVDPVLSVGQNQEDGLPFSNEDNFSGSFDQEVPGTDVHTMPSKFLQPFKAPKKKGRLSWIVLGSVIFVVLGAVIVVAVIFLNGEKPGVTVQPVNNLPNRNINSAPANENANSNANDNSNVNQAVKTPQSRDAKRLADVFDVRSALQMYFAKQKVYPTSLSTLLRDYLTVVPINPTPGGEEYAYTVNEDKSDFSFTFSLEEGGALGNLMLEPAKYVLTSEDVSIFSEEGAITDPDSGLPALPGEPAEPIMPVMGQDTDGDQLTDIEENLYQTNPSLVDTDGDSFSDLAEILGLYDPTKDGGAKLFDSGLVDVYQNQTYHYSLLYPASWTARALTAENKEIIFNSNIGEFIEIIVQSNPLGLSAYNWYVSQNPNINTGNLTTLLVDNLPAVQSPDGLTTYLGAGSNIYVITYNVGTTQQMNFYSTYQFFLETFMFLQATEPASAEGGQ